VSENIFSELGPHGDHEVYAVAQEALSALDVLRRAKLVRQAQEQGRLPHGCGLHLPVTWVQGVEDHLAACHRVEGLR